jgi:plasmid maintenance system antidote protein VapI
MFDTDELLARLKEKGVKNIEIARALDLPDSRVPEIYRKDRALKLDEAVKLVRAFRLEQDQAIVPLQPQVLRLLVRYMAMQLGASLAEDDPRMEELTADIRAFSAFVADPKIRRSIEAAEGFFEAMRLRRPDNGSKAPQESDPAPTH